MPVTPRQICTDLIILLGVFDNLHINVNNRHSLGAASQPGVGAPAGSAAGSPVKEGSFLQRQTSASADEGDDDAAAAANGKDTGNSADAQAIPRR